MIHDTPEGDRQLIEMLAKRRPKLELIRSGTWAFRFERPSYDSVLRWQLWLGPYLVRRWKAPGQ